MRRDDLVFSPPPTKDNPHQRFRCGRDFNQSPCPLGPTAAGGCPFATGHYPSGPHATGPHASHACHPVRTWSGFRRRAVLTAGVLFAALLVFTLGTEIAPETIRPGDLTTQHAQILSAASNSQKCAACHNNDLTEGWFSAFAQAHGSDLQDSMNDRCLDCHHGQFSPGLELVAHNLSRLTRQDLSGRKIPANDFAQLISRTFSSSLDQENLACAVCHQEHQGSQANLSEISNARCQACHVQSFDSFASGHPDFPEQYGGGGSGDSNAKIAFDHVRHASIHYPKQALQDTAYESFDCRRCHQTSGADELVDATSGDSIKATLPYEVACASCHDTPLRTATSEGPTLIGLPTVPSVVAERMESWPSAATGMPDGSIPPLTAALMRSKSGSATVHSTIEYSQLNWNDPTIVEGVVADNARLRQQIIDLAIGGQTQLEQSLIDAGMSATNARAIASSFPPILLRDAALGWFQTSQPSQSSASGTVGTSSNNDLSPDTDLLLGQAGSSSLDPLLSGDAWSTSTSANDWIQQLGKRMNANVVQSLGGWVRDDFTVSISYRGTGHADPVLAAVTQWAAGLPESDPIRRPLLNQPAVSQCISCHVGVVQESQSDSGDPWHAVKPKSFVEQLNYFSHRAHLTIASLADCQSCHQLQTLVPTSEQTAQFEFDRIQKQDCAVCHTSSAAGDSCTQCHRYHVH